MQKNSMIKIKLKNNYIISFKKILVYFILISLFILFENKAILLNASENELSLNKEIIFGKLNNGLTYYIKKNSKPKNKASIYLILKAGSLVKDDNQLGLAHLIEHMAFNGTKKNPNKEIDNYLSSIDIELRSDYKGLKSRGINKLHCLRQSQVVSKHYKS
jgi:zinc protease